MRRATINRHTTETQIDGRLVLEGRGRYDISTGIGFFDHMLELFTKHGGFDLTLKVRGDLHVDQHHTVEDAGIALGEAVATAIGNKRGINRAGYFVMPMDETLAVAAIDLSGRPFAVVFVAIRRRHQDCDVLSDQFVFRIAEHLLGGGIHIVDDSAMADSTIRVYFSTLF